MRKIKPIGILLSALLLLSIAGGLLVFAPKVSAATIIVTTTADENNDPGPDTGCSLYEAIEAANTDTAYGGCAAGNGADTINVPAGTYSIDINPLPAVNDSLSIIGDSSGGTIIDGGEGIEFMVYGSEEHLLRNLTIRNANNFGIRVQGESDDYVVTIDRVTVEDSGGVGIDHTRTTNSNSGSVYIINSLIQNNSSYGVINNECQGVGTMYITNSMVRDNQETGVYNICGHIVMDRVTVSGNTSNINAGGIENSIGNGQAVLDMTNVTVAYNSSDSNVGGVLAGAQFTSINSTIAYNQGGIDVGGLDASTAPENVVIHNTLIANNQAAECVEFPYSIGEASNNLASDESCWDGNASFNENPIADMKLASSLADAGGSASIGAGGLGGNVLTLALLNGSPALNAGNNNFCPEVDERNAGRPFEDTCDVGAFEAHFANNISGDDADTPGTLADTGQSTLSVMITASIAIICSLLMGYWARTKNRLV